MAIVLWKEYKCNFSNRCIWDIKWCPPEKSSRTNLGYSLRRKGQIRVPTDWFLPITQSYFSSSSSSMQQQTICSSVNRTHEFIKFLQLHSLFWPSIPLLHLTVHVLIQAPHFFLEVDIPDPSVILYKDGTTVADTYQTILLDPGVNSIHWILPTSPIK